MLILTSRNEPGLQGESPGDHRLAFTFCLMIFVAWNILLFCKYAHFGYYDWDLAFFAQAMWNLSHGDSFTSIITEGNFFGNHSNFIAVLLIPIYKIFPHPMLLVSLKLASITAAGWFIYRYADRVLGRKESLLILALYFLFPANIFGILYEFDMEALATGVAAGMFYAYMRNYWKNFLWCGLVLIIIKENLPLIVLAFGVHALFTKKDKWKWAGIPIIMGASTFFILTMFLVPYFTGHGITSVHPYAGQFSHFGKNVPEILWNLLARPMGVVEVLNTHENQIWFAQNFGHVLLLPIFCIPVMFLVSPVILMNLLSDPFQRHTIFYSYMLVVVPFMFFALTRVMMYLPRTRIVLLSFSMVLTAVSLYQFQPEIKYRLFPYPFSMTGPRQALMSKVPPDAAVVASFPFLARMTNRRDLYPLYKIYSPLHSAYMLPNFVQYALVDTSDIWYNPHDRLTDACMKMRLSDFLKSGWVLIEQQGPLALYKRAVPRNTEELQ